MWNKLQELIDLEYNWNGYLSPKIQSKAIQTAKRIIKIIEEVNKSDEIFIKEPLILPVSGGGIQFEWNDIEVEILPDGSIEYLNDDTGFFESLFSNW